MNAENTQKQNGNTSLIEEMFNVGAHFGYTKSRRHPSFRSIIFGTKKKVDIVNLEKTGLHLSKALDFIGEYGRQNKVLLFVGTKPEARKIVEEAGKTLNTPFVSNRWIGGTLTNFPQIRRRVSKFTGLLEKRSTGALDVYTKKERLLLDREIEKLRRNFSGIVGMEKLPDALFVIDPRHEDIAVSEARQLNIPIVALAGSDCNLADIAYSIPANDASISSILFFTDKVIKAYQEGKKSSVPEPKPENTQS
ncbi:MAG: 30S ribosomal protein S2 [Patescibacteria group bacterium]